MAVKYGAAHHYFALGMLVLSGAAVGTLLFYLKTAATLGFDRVAVEKISGKDANAMSYIVDPFDRLVNHQMTQDVSVLQPEGVPKKE